MEYFISDSKTIQTWPAQIAEIRSCLEFAAGPVAMFFDGKCYRKCGRDEFIAFAEAALQTLAVEFVELQARRELIFDLAARGAASMKSGMITDFGRNKPVSSYHKAMFHCAESILISGDDNFTSQWKRTRDEKLSDLESLFASSDLAIPDCEVIEVRIELERAHALNCCPTITMANEQVIETATALEPMIVNLKDLTRVDDTRADTRKDRKKFSTIRSQDVLDLIQYLKRHFRKGKSEIAIARNFVGNRPDSEKKAINLLRSARRHGSPWR